MPYKAWEYHHESFNYLPALKCRPLDDRINSVLHKTNKYSAYIAFLEDRLCHCYCGKKRNVKKWEILVSAIAQNLDSLNLDESRLIYEADYEADQVALQQGD